MDDATNSKRLLSDRYQTTLPAASMNRPLHSFKISWQKIVGD